MFPRDLDKKLKDKDKELTKLRKDIVNIKQDYEGTKTLLADKEKKIAQLEEQLSTEVKARKGAVKEIEPVQTKLKGVKNELTQIKALLEEKDQKLRQLEEENVFTKESLTQKEKELIAVKASLRDTTSNFTVLSDKYKGIQAQMKRPIATPARLTSSFVNAMETMRKQIRTPEESTIDYRIKNFDITLKSGIGVDEEDNVTFWLPKAEELTPDQLSTIKFSINAVPKFKKRIKKEEK